MSPGRFGVLFGVALAFVGALGPRWHVLSQASAGTDADFFVPLVALLIGAAVVMVSWKAPAAAGVAFLASLIVAGYGITESLQFSEIAAETSLISRGWGLPTIAVGGAVMLVSSLPEARDSIRALAK